MSDYYEWKVKGKPNIIHAIFLKLIQACSVFFLCLPGALSLASSKDLKLVDH